MQDEGQTGQEVDPKARFPSSRPFFLSSSLLPYTFVAWLLSSPPPTPHPQSVFLSLPLPGQPGSSRVTFRVFQAVGQPTTLPGPGLCIEHRVEPQLAQLECSPLQQGDLVLDGQVPGSKDASGGQLPRKPPQASTPPLIQKAREGEGRGRMGSYCEDCCCCFQRPPISPPPNPVKHIPSPCHLPLVSFYLQGLPCQWSLSSRSLTAWPRLL